MIDRIFLFPLLVLSLAACGEETVVDAGRIDAGGGMDAGARDAGGVFDSGGNDGGAGSDARVDAPMMMGSDGSLGLACTLEELQPIIECAAMACVSLPDASLPDPGELASCILTNCGLLVFGVSGDCRGCLLAGVGMDLDEIAMACAPGITPP